MANDNALTMFTDEQIKEEIRRRAAAEEQRRKAEVSEAVTLCKKEIYALLKFIPTHELASCTDGDTVNVDRGCNRCVAIGVEQGYVEAVAHVRLVVVR